VDVRDLTLTLVRSLRPVADASKITVLTALPAGMPLVRGDRERLTQALVNLFQNALKYTPAGGLVRLEASASATHVRISVQDTGIGVAQEDLERIFEPFYRTDASRARTTGGAGLGLTLVRELIEAMNGTIHAESEPGRGSRFSLELPIWTED
jgi:signal transduction histidine kinase